MFKQSNSQSSLFDAGHYLKDALPEDDWAFIYRDRIFPLIDETKYKHLYSESEGRPNASIKLMISLLIFMGLEKYNWRNMEYQFSRRIDWMIATHTEIGKAFIDHTTLFKFFQRLEDDETALSLFVELTDMFIEQCGTSVSKQRTDSFFIHGWLKILSRYGLFKETIRKFLLSLRKQKPGLYDKIKEQLSKAYLEKDFDITEKDKEQAAKRIKEMAVDLHKIVLAFDNHRQVKHYETYKILKQVFNQQCEVKKIPQSSEIEIKDKPDKKAINSPHNPEAQFRKKGKQQVRGDVGFITETCDRDNKTQFITDVDVTEVTVHDSKQLPEIQERLEKNGFKPEEQYVDAGFVNGETIKESQKKGIDLEGPSAGHNQSVKKYNDGERSLDIIDFETSYNEETGEVIVHKCPAGHKPVKQKKSKKTDQYNVFFKASVCRECPLKAQCPLTRIGKKNAVLTVKEESYISAKRYHYYMQNTEYRKKCSIRAGVESLVNEIANIHGMRKSRHRKRSRTKLQMIFASLACNVKRYITHGQNYGYLEPKCAC